VHKAMESLTPETGLGIASSGSIVVL
jgi:hypothetical protein